MFPQCVDPGGGSVNRKLQTPERINSAYIYIYLIFESITWLSTFLDQDLDKYTKIHLIAVKIKFNFFNVWTFKFYFFKSLLKA